MQSLKVVNVEDKMLEFDNGMMLLSYPYQSCCEQLYLSYSDLSLDDFLGLEFDLSNDGFFERVYDYGIKLKSKCGHCINIPVRGLNNFCFSSHLNLVVSSPIDNGEYAIYDIFVCEDWID